MTRRHKTPTPRPAQLFPDPEHAVRAHIAEIDGASRNNPGPASYGVVIRTPNGDILHEFSKYLGIKTNNQAEYFALIAALDYAKEHRITALHVRSDSELLVRQMQGHYKVRSAALRQPHEQARKLARALAHFSVEHVPRERNREADRLANQALDQTATRGQRPAISGEGETRNSIPKYRDQTRPPEKRVRARYRRGALHPAEPLNLAEGAEVELTIHRASRAKM